MAPEAGLEPATLALTALCSTIELLRNRRVLFSPAARMNRWIIACLPLLVNQGWGPVAICPSWPPSTSGSGSILCLFYEHNLPSNTDAARPVLVLRLFV